MMAPNFVDEFDFFDTIDDLLEFPPEEDSTKELQTSTPAEFPSIWTNPSEGFDAAVFSTNTSSDLSAHLSVPYEDMVQLEWLSTFVEDSFSEKSTRDRRSHSSSPVSVLESSSSGKNPNTNPNPSTNPAESDVLARSKPGKSKSRSKRPRPAAFNPRLPFQLVSHSDPKMVSEFENSDLKKKQKKSKRMKLGTGLAQADADSNPATQNQYLRKCQHCEITKTPQWRAGPMGPKTLCNACGVRHKSGRLFPEYRPAASPTFVPAMHSNSHKKVLEMRVKVGAEGSPPPAPLPSKKIPKTSPPSLPPPPEAVAPSPEKKFLKTAVPPEVVLSKNDALQDHCNVICGVN